MNAIQIESNEYELNRVKKECLVLLWVRFKLNQTSMNWIESKKNTSCCYECDSNRIKRVWIELSQKRTPRVVMSAIWIESSEYKLNRIKREHLVLL
jgi:hypothetical protein